MFTATACTSFRRAWIRAMVSFMHICHNISELTKSQQNFLLPLGSMHFFFRSFCREDTQRSNLIFLSTLLTCVPQHSKVKKEKFSAHLPFFSNSHSCSLKRSCQFRNNPKRSDVYRSTSVLVRPRWWFKTDIASMSKLYRVEKRWQTTNSKDKNQTYTHIRPSGPVWYPSFGSSLTRLRLPKCCVIDLPICESVLVIPKFSPPVRIAEVVNGANENKKNSIKVSMNELYDQTWHESVSSMQADYWTKKNELCKVRQDVQTNCDWFRWHLLRCRRCRRVLWHMPWCLLGLRSTGVVAFILPH